MHIVDSTMFWSPTSGGVKTYLLAKRRWLSRQPGIRHSLVVPGDHAGCRDGVCAVASPPLPFGGGYRFPLRKDSWRRQLLALSPDIIEAGDPYRPAWAALEAGKCLQVPVIGFYHSDLPRLIGSRAGHWTNHSLDAYVRRLYSRFDRVLTPSQVMADKLQVLGLQRVCVQPLGVDVERFHPRLHDPAFRRSLGLDDDVRLLIFAGRGAREKNLGVLLETLQQLGRGYHLHLVGSHMPRHLPDNVSRSRDFLAPEEVARRLASSDALVHAGDRETFGLVVLEAMASGLPVVGVRAGAVAELVVPGTGLLAAPLSAESLADTVRALFADGWKSMGRLARSHVEQNYAWHRVLQQLLGHYRELTGISGDPAMPHGKAAVGG